VARLLSVQVNKHAPCRGVAAWGVVRRKSTIFAMPHRKEYVMGLFSESLNSFDDLFTHQLQVVYDAENQLIEALPKMADASSSSDLRNAFNTHLLETRVHAQRLEQVFRTLGKDAERTTCPAMKGLIKEGSETINATGDPKVKDAALIASAQRVEHYEIAAYGTLRALANQIGLDDVARVFQQILDEEGNTDKKLTRLAESHINAEAAANA
jgi:ferritin-like metal-binding protein YciE